MNLLATFKAYQVRLSGSHRDRRDFADEIARCFEFGPVETSLRSMKIAALLDRK